MFPQHFICKQLDFVNLYFCIRIKQGSTPDLEHPIHYQFSLQVPATACVSLLQDWWCVSRQSSTTELRKLRINL